MHDATELWTRSEYPGVAILMQRRCTQVLIDSCIHVPLQWTINRLYCQISNEVIIESKELANPQYNNQVALLSAVEYVPAPERVYLHQQPS